MEYTFSEFNAKNPKMVQEFYHYISLNRNFIPNYSERYRYGETISTRRCKNLIQSKLHEKIWSLETYKLMDLIASGESC